MPRPSIVRADTIDLQPQQQPSAKDHSNAPDSPRGASGVAPHQSQAIRNAVEEHMAAQNPTAPLNGHKAGADDDELEDAEIAGDEDGFDDDDMMDKMSSSPSIADEDIDFEMVYALHTFNATVEGQANAGKGEHMVLLDDSNSYWWLVRIIRDGTIGYLPAEHIETPTERLARLNKHRNIDLSANMLGDAASGGTKNPIKKAMRRRHAKNVQFGEPIYIEASELEYTTDEEGEEGFLTDDEDGANAEGEEEPQKTNGKADEPSAGQTTTTITAGGAARSTVNVVHSADSRNGEEINTDGVKLRPNPTPSALRHPDSAVFRDEGGETKKLTLTPSLLRGEEGITGPKPEVIKGRSSMEHRDSKERTRDNVLSPPPGGKDGHRLKKGGSVLGSLFKKRGRRGKKDSEDDVDEFLHSSEKRSLDGKESSESTRDTVLASVRTEETKKEKEKEREKEREAEEVQKRQQEEKQRQMEQQRRQQEQERRKQEQLRQERERDRLQRERELSQKKAQQQQAAAPAATTNSAAANATVTAAASTIRRVDPEADTPSPASLRPAPNALTPERNSPLQARRPSNEVSPVSPEPKSLVSAQLEPKSRSPVQSSPSPNPTNPATRQPPTEKPAQTATPYKPATYVPAPAPVPTRRAPSPEPTPSPDHERLSESPEHITFHDATERPDLVVDTSTVSSNTSSPLDSSPEMIERLDSSADEHNMARSAAADAARKAGGAPIQRSWSDWSLRTYFEDDNDVRDMLIVVQQDKGDQGITKDHPDIVPIYEDSSRRLQDITKRLDGMLGDWLQRRGTRTPVSTTSS